MENAGTDSSFDETRKDTVKINDILNGENVTNEDNVFGSNDKIDSKTDNNGIAKNDVMGNVNDDDSETFDLSKVKSEVTEVGSDNVNGKSPENEDYYLDTDTETEDTVDHDEIAHSSEKLLSNRNEEDVKPELDRDTQVIVLNKHNKFNARPKPDPSCLRHECDRCEEAFQFPYQLARHKNIKHEGKYPYSCSVCTKPFDRSSSLRDHMFVHTENRPYACKLCDKRFKMKGNLRKHIRDVHTEHEGPKLKFQCEYCSKIFPTKERLTSHFIVHDTEKAFACNVCGKKFNRKNNLKEHVVIHSTEKNFICPDCGMRFNRKYSLKIHARNHMEVKPYKCELCPSSFSQLHALKTHFRLHTGEKPFKCTICEKTFRQLATLQVHFKRHTGVKDFKCGICGKGFVIKRRLIEHERLHTGEKPFSCDICPYRTATSSGLRLHKKTHARQMESLGIDQIENLLNDGSQSISPDGRKRKVSKKGKMFGLIVSTKHLKKNSVPVSRNKNIDANVEDTNIENDVDRIDNMEGNDDENLSENYGTELKPVFSEVTENFINESLIEIVNDIADAEHFADGLSTDQIAMQGTENTSECIDLNDMNVSEPQISKEEKKGKGTKKAINVKEIEFRNVAKEVLYKHLNEFIPAIDADLLAEKIDLISQELSETHTKTSTRKLNSAVAKKSKNNKAKRDNKSASFSENIEGNNSLLNVVTSTGIVLSQMPGSDPPVETYNTFTFGTQTMHEEIPSEKLAMQPSLSTPVASSPHLVRQLLSNSHPVNSQQSPVLAMTKRQNSPLNPVGEKPFLSSTLRNMLVSKRPEPTTKQTVSMTTQDSFIKKEIPAVSHSATGPSGVLRNMLSAPPKHYLVSTKNSYAALQHSIKRQTETGASRNGFQGKWYTPGTSTTESDFPWVDEPEPAQLQYDLKTIKVEPISP